TAQYLRRHYPPGARLFMIGESGLRAALDEAGFELARGEVQAVVVGMDRDLTYEKLRAATILIRSGARFVGTNPDLTFPSEEDLVPGAGAILAAIEAATGVAPIVVGKPEPLLFQQALDRMDVDPGKVAVIGDRIETDVLGGTAAGLTTILVMTGAARREDLAEAEVRPDHVLESLAELHLTLSSLHSARERT
ncbi:MAG: HAD-IIA family hydrolase, partial [Candidatus Methylomirabilia bacterium]